MVSGTKNFGVLGSVFFWVRFRYSFGQFRFFWVFSPPLSLSAELYQKDIHLSWSSYMYLDVCCVFQIISEKVPIFSLPASMKLEIIRGFLFWVCFFIDSYLWGFYLKMKTIFGSFALSLKKKKSETLHQIKIYILLCSCQKTEKVW